MFIVLFGLTGIAGDVARNYLETNGFPLLKKTYYSSSVDDAAYLRECGHHVVSCKEEIVANCDYYYSTNHRTNGFNKKDFADAVQGTDSKYITFTSLDIDFLKKLKADYGNYVTIVYAYIDDITLQTVTKKYSDKGRRERIITSKKIKDVYINNITLFDSTIIYGGEDSAFNFKSLESQLSNIIEKAKTNEVLLNSQRKVQLPYVGPEDYIFVSYSHKDKKIVEDKLHILQRNGFRVWYDSGIHGGEDWKKVLREKIKYCTDFVVFTSKNSTLSEDVKIEIITAEIYEKKIINITLDYESGFEGTIENILHNLHAIDGKSALFENIIITSFSESTREPIDK